MDISHTKELEDFRKEVRSWLEGVMPSILTEDPDLDHFENFIRQKRLWDQKLYEGGYAGLTWPKQYGGRGESDEKQIVFNEECGRVNAPYSLNIIGNNIIGPTLLEIGTEEQKKRFIPKIVSGEEIWCQGFSEPNAGSDLASLRTTAVLDGDHWVINGQKIWSSWAQYSQYCILLARTDKDAPKHKGITFFLMPMNLEGITVKPLVTMSDEREFSEIFLDNVRLEKDAVLGEVNDGWNVAMRALSFERGTNPVGKQARFYREFMDFIHLSKTIGDPSGEENSILGNPYYQQKIAKLYIELEIMKYLGYQVVDKLIKKQKITYESSLQKLFWSEYHKRFGDAVMEMLGEVSMLWKQDGVMRGKYQNLFLHSKAETIYAGTSEIQKNIIAERILGMPR